jgi:hypothetical protein
MSKRLEIEFIIKNAQARATVRRTVADFAVQQKAAERTAAAQARAAERAAQAAVRASARASAAQQRAADQAVRAAQQAADRVVMAAQKVADAQQRAADRATAAVAASSQRQSSSHTRAAAAASKAADRQADAAQRAADRQAAAVARAEQRKADMVERIEARYVAADLRRQAMREQRAEQSARRAADRKVAAAWRSFEQQDRAAERSADRQAAIARKIARDQAREADRIRRAWIGVSASGEIASSSLKSMAVNAIGITALVATGADLDQTMARAVERTRQAADELLKLKGAVREVSTIQGELGVNDAYVSKYLDLRKQSGLSDAAAQSFLAEYSGANESNIGVNISREESDKAKPLLARFAAAQGGTAEDAGTYGRLAGQLQSFYKDQTAGQSLANTAKFSRTLSLGVGTNPTLIRNAMKQAGVVLNDIGTGAIRDPQELAALISTASKASPTGSGHMITALHRSLRVGEQGEELRKAAGITADDDIVASIHKTNTYLAAMEKKGVAPDKAVADLGIKNTQDVRAITTFYTYRNHMQRFLAEAHKPMTAEQAQADLDTKFRTDVGLRDQVAQAKVDAAKHTQAMQYQHALPLEKEALASLIEKGQSPDDPSQATHNWAVGKISSVGGVFTGGQSSEEFGQMIQLENEMFRLAQKRGQTVPNRPEDIGTLLGGYNFKYLGWLKSGSWRSDYSTLGSNQELASLVMPAARPPGAAAMAAAPPMAPGPIAAGAAAPPLLPVAPPAMNPGQPGGIFAPALGGLMAPPAGGAAPGVGAQVPGGQPANHAAAAAPVVQAIQGLGKAILAKPARAPNRPKAPPVPPGQPPRP